jgi:Anti-sigma-K factor rskA
MNTQHETIEELIAVRSLGGLDPDDLAHLEELMTAHGPSCRDCRRLRDQYEEVAGRLGLAVAPEEIPPGFEDELVRLAGRKRETWGARRLVAAAAAAVILVAGGIGGYLLAPRHSANPLAGAQIVTTHGSVPGTLTFAFRPGNGQSFLVASGLPDAPPRHLYELWFFHGTTPTRAATFRPSDGVAVVQIPADSSGAGLAAVTIERSPGVSKPTTEPIFSAPTSGPIRTS